MQHVQSINPGAPAYIKRHAHHLHRSPITNGPTSQQEASHKTNLRHASNGHNASRVRVQTLLTPGLRPPATTTDDAVPAPPARARVWSRTPSTSAPAGPGTGIVDGNTPRLCSIYYKVHVCCTFVFLFSFLFAFFIPDVAILAGNQSNKTHIRATYATAKAI